MQSILDEIPCGAQKATLENRIKTSGRPFAAEDAKAGPLHPPSTRHGKEQRLCGTMPLAAAEAPHKKNRQPTKEDSQNDAR